MSGVGHSERRGWKDAFARNVGYAVGATVLVVGDLVFYLLLRVVGLRPFLAGLITVLGAVEFGVVKNHG